MTDNKIKVLDHGFVKLVDHMGDDHAIAQAARVSTQKHDKEKAKNDRSLIRYLMKHRHTSPFEMVEFKFHTRHPIFVARQWIRHRTASVNEVSGRYSELPTDYYIPKSDRLSYQSKMNKQGSGQQLEADEAAKIQDRMYKRQFDISLDYQNFLAKDLSREIARINLPLATYTEWYWKMDLHNLFHFLKLRLDSHAQYEIRVYAEAIYEIIKPIVPIACEAFEDYVLNAKTFSAQEMDMIKKFPEALECMVEDAEALVVIGQWNTREFQEFKKKLGI
jgi:thymidylate synthase (FAD)